jgi:hypothetical protein
MGGRSNWFRGGAGDARQAPELSLRFTADSIYFHGTTPFIIGVSFTFLLRSV